MQPQSWTELAGGASREALVTEWHERRSADLLLRLAGIVLIAIAYAAGAALRHPALVDVNLEGDAIADLLAAGPFLSASAGCAALFTGRHLFDRVRIARRWSSLDWNDSED